MGGAEHPHAAQQPENYELRWLIRREENDFATQLNIEAQAVVKLSGVYRLVPGEGNITVNNRDVREYLPFESLILDLNQPFDVTETKGTMMFR